MKVIIIVLTLLFILFLLWLFSLMPRRKRKEMLPFLKTAYAHRGLHGDGVPENSLLAFQKAVEAGFGIELDVQLSSDGEVMVFHDESLLRMTGCDASLYAKTKEELSHLRLSESEQAIPTLREVLSLVDGKVPLLVEIKSDHGVTAVCEKTAALLDGYTGPYMIESFHPFAVNWFRKNREGVVRGQLSARLFTKKKRTISYLLVQNLLLNFLARPDFIAYDYHHRRQISFSLCRFFFRPYTIAWTVKDTDALRLSRKFDTVIFECLSYEELAAKDRLPSKKSGEKQ